MTFPEVEKNLNYTFKDKELLKRALTLSSYDNNFNNQSLEFLGDAVLELIVSEKIFALDADEGILTTTRANVVCDGALTLISQKLGLDKALIKAEGDTNNKKAVPSAYEAVIAAIYLDGGLNAAKKFVNSTLDYDYKDVNYKGELQELLAKRGEAAQYVSQDIGTVQNPEFKTVLTVAGKTFEGVAKSKQQAEKNAARYALEYLKNN